MNTTTKRYEARELPTGRFQTWDSEKGTYVRTGVSRKEAQRIADQKNKRTN